MVGDVQPPQTTSGTDLDHGGSPMVTESQRHALRLLAASPDGCTEDFLYVNGIKIATLVDLVNTGLASVSVEKRAQKLDHRTSPANGARGQPSLARGLKIAHARPKIEIVRLTITPAGRARISVR